MRNRLLCLLFLGFIGTQAANAQGGLDVEGLHDVLFPPGTAGQWWKSDTHLFFNRAEGTMEVSGPNRHRWTRPLVGQVRFARRTGGFELTIDLDNGTTNLKISWTANQEDGRSGRMEILGNLDYIKPGERGPNVEFRSSTLLRRVEDGSGVELEEAHFPSYRGPEPQSSTMEKVEIVIRPNKVRIVIKTDGAQIPGKHFTEWQPNRKLILSLDRE